MLRGNFCDRSEAQSYHEIVALLIQIFLDLVSHHHQNVSGFIHQLRQAEIADSLLCEIR